MNHIMTKSSIKGNDTVALTLSPSDALEREFFNKLLNTEISIEKITGTDQIRITPKIKTNEPTIPGIEITEPEGE